MFLSLLFVAIFCVVGNCCIASVGDDACCGDCFASCKETEKSVEAPVSGCEADAKKLAETSQPVADTDEDDDDDDFDPAEFLKVAQLLKEGSSEKTEADTKA